LAFGGVGTIPFLIIQGLTLPVLLLWGVRLWLHPSPRLLFPPICWVVLAFAAYAIGRYYTADIEYVARQELTKVLVYTFLFFAIVNNLHRREAVQIITFTMLGLGMLIAGYAIYQYLAGSNRVWHLATPYQHRGTGTYINPNHLGGFLELLLPLALATALLARFKPVPRILAGYAGLVIFAGIGVTLSRGAWVASLVGLLLFCAVLMSYRIYRLPLLALLILVVGATAIFLNNSPAAQFRLARISAEGGKVNDNMRFSMWRPAVQVWKENPWWGAGPAHFDFRFRAHRPILVQMRPDRVHNDYLNTLADWGLVGFGLIAAAWGVAAFTLHRSWRYVRGSSTELGDQKRSTKYSFVVGASVGLVSLLLHSWIDFNWHIPANAILAVCLLALLSSFARFATERYWVRVGWVLRVVINGLLLAGMIWLGSEGRRKYEEHGWLQKASQAPPYSEEQVRVLKKAHAVDPMNFNTTYNIGEGLRMQSAEGGRNYGKLAEEALGFFQLGMKLNRWDGYQCLGYGFCLDWLDRREEADPYFLRAEALDPNGLFMMSQIGIRYVRLGEYAAARPWLERSIMLGQEDNTLPRNYLKICDARLLEAATNNVAGSLLKVPVPAR
jgi:O-antigen ligase